MDRALFFTPRSLAFSCILALLINLVVFGATPAMAASFTVNVPNDADDTTPGDDICDTSTDPGPQCTLRAAITEANLNPGEDTITVDPAEVNQVVLTIAGMEDANAMGDLDLTDTDTTTILGNGVRVIQNADERVFHVRPDASAVFNSLSAESGQQVQGGGVFNDGTLLLTNTAVVNSTASDGGGVFNGGDLTIINSLLEGNAAGMPNGEGGGLYNEGPLTSTGTSFRDNSAFTDGGGLYNSGVLASVEGGDFRTNTAFAGGGIYNENLVAGQLILTDVTVGGGDGAGNEATFGGGILNSGLMTVTDGTVNGNTAETSGGGINTLYSPDDPCTGCHLSIDGTVVRSNTAVTGDGGGIAASPCGTCGPGDQSDGVDANDIQVINNVAGGTGAGFYGNFGPISMASDVTITDSTIENNAADEHGGGVAFIGTLGEITGTSVIGNEAGVPNTDRSAAHGGGYYFSNSTVRVRGGQVTGNRALLGNGGGIWNQGSLEHVFGTIAGNRAANGGGIYNLTSTASGDAMFLSVVDILENIAEGTPDPNGLKTGKGEGGGVWSDGLMVAEFGNISRNTATANTTGTAGGEGGGFYNAGAVEDLTPDQSTNEYEDSEACQAVLEVGLMLNRGAACLTEVTLSANTAEGDADPNIEQGADNAPAGKGGGIWNQAETPGFIALTALDRVVLANNEAAHGGGVYSNDAALYVTESAFTGNFAGDPNTSTAGGGAYISGIGPSTGINSIIEASSFEANDSGNGGGIYYGRAPDRLNTLTASTLNENIATRNGGGIWNDTKLDLLNDTISGNEAGHEGGGLFNIGGGRVTSNAVTFHDNSAQSDSNEAGGNIHDESLFTVIFRMTILSEGSPNNCNTNDDGNFIDDGWNLEDDDTCQLNEQAGSIVNGQPELDELDDNGGPTLTHALRRGSDALDAISTGFCPPPDVDQRYRDRPGDGGGDEFACDIGAFEHQTSDAFPSSGGGGGGGNPSPQPTRTDEPEPEPSSSSNPAPNPTNNPAPPPRCAAQARELGLNLIVGTKGDDRLIGTNKADVICAKAGDDVARGRGGNDIIWLSGGDDRGSGGNGSDTIRGGRGADTVNGNTGSDEITLGNGRDLAEGGKGSDRLFGMKGNDDLRGMLGNDFLYGDGGRDNCVGGPGNDNENNCET